MSRVLSLICLLGATPAFAAESSRPVTVIYPVADLVVPADTRPVTVTLGEAPPPDTARPAKKARTTERQLVRLVTSTVAPAGWEGCRAEYRRADGALVVTQTPAVQEKVAGMLEALRRLQDQSVSVELRVVRLPEAASDRLGLVKGGGGAVVDQAELSRVLDAVQGDRRAAIVQAPKVTACDGQRVDFRLPDDGVELRVMTQPSADRRSARVSLRLRRDGAEDVTFKAEVGQGGSVALPGWAARREVRAEFGPPVLSRIPYVNRLFKNVAVGHEEERVLLLVTPRVLDSAE
ncbi:MAG: hypothetical protein ACRC33_19800 [Gemmataceae bacterium]